MVKKGNRPLEKAVQKLIEKGNFPGGTLSPMKTQSSTTRVPVIELSSEEINKVFERKLWKKQEKNKIIQDQLDNITRSHI